MPRAAAPALRRAKKLQPETKIHRAVDVRQRQFLAVAAAAACLLATFAVNVRSSRASSQMRSELASAD
ncbi:MAG TPA: hypothetical protein VGD38_09590, partial [Pyrinomonadaceae bacterium]